MMTHTDSIKTNLQTIKARIAGAALRAGRSPDEVHLVAVSKTFPAQAILAAWVEGQRDFGENRPEEGAAKIPEVEAMIQDARPTWHMIGHIQRRKTNLVIEHFNFIHSLDRLVLAQKLSTLAMAAHKEIPVLLECNVSGEVSKYGYTASGWEHDAGVRDAFYREVSAVLALPGLRVEGLMTMAPISEDAETARPIFASLRALRDALRGQFPTMPWPHLSMGMTDDFEVAVEEGATFVRIGRAIFGRRQ